MIDRNALSYLNDWAKEEDRKPLVLRGEASRKDNPYKRFWENLRRIFKAKFGQTS